MAVEVDPRAALCLAPVSSSGNTQSDAYPVGTGLGRGQSFQEKVKVTRLEHEDSSRQV